MAGWRGGHREELSRAAAAAQRELRRVAAASHARLELLDRLAAVYEAERAVQDEWDALEGACDDLEREIRGADNAHHLAVARGREHEVGGCIYKLNLVHL